MIFQIFAIIFLSLLLILWTVLPLLKALVVAGGERRDELAEERLHSLYQSLGSLYTSKERGAVAEDDFQNIERRLILEAAKILRALGVDPKGAAAEARQTAPSGKKRFCGHCGAKRKPEFQFCPICGKGYRAA